jgi:hypothetical protein
MASSCGTWWPKSPRGTAPVMPLKPTIDWRFTTADAPIELTHLSPAIEP